MIRRFDKVWGGVPSISDFVVSYVSQSQKNIPNTFKSGGDR